MKLKPPFASPTPRVTKVEDRPSSEPFGRAKVNADKLADKLQNLPSAKVSDKLLLVAAKLHKRQQARIADTRPPPEAAAEAGALDPQGDERRP